MYSVLIVHIVSIIMFVLRSTALCTLQSSLMDDWCLVDTCYFTRGLNGDGLQCEHCNKEYITVHIAYGSGLGLIIIIIIEGLAWD